MGVEVNVCDIDIAHRIPIRNASAGTRPIFANLLVELSEIRILQREKATNVRAESIGLQSNPDACFSKLNYDCEASYAKDTNPFQ